jgi:hypothetical protein
MDGSAGLLVGVVRERGLGDRNGAAMGGFGFGVSEVVRRVVGIVIDVSECDGLVGEC